MVTGRNVYAPCVIHDAQENKYKMWYGGWQNNSDAPNDNIYYRESTNGVNWGPATQVLNHGTLGMYHVNDPSVIKTWNAALGRYMYWMAFTAIDCDPNVCSITNHHIIMGSGFDGKTFGAFQTVVANYDTNGVFSPSLVSINDATGEFWLYYQITGVADRIILTKLIGGTTPTSTQEVFVSSFDGAHNPDVARRPDGSWAMLFNRIDTSNVFNIWKVSSADGITWTNEQPILINSCSPFCVTTTPNQLWTSPTNYTMFFGLDETLSNPSAEIHGWKMQEP